MLVMYPFISFTPLSLEGLKLNSSLFFVVFGDFENFGLTFCDKKQSAIFFVKSEGVNTSPSRL
jgi:hypothetical protein